MDKAMTSARLSSSMRYASAGGQDEQPCEVNNSTRVGGVAGSAWEIEAANRAAPAINALKMFFMHKTYAVRPLAHQSRFGDDFQPPYAAMLRSAYRR